MEYAVVLDIKELNISGMEIMGLVSSHHFGWTYDRPSELEKFETKEEAEHFIHVYPDMEGIMSVLPYKEAFESICVQSEDMEVISLDNIRLMNEYREKNEVPFRMTIDERRIFMKKYRK